MEKSLERRVSDEVLRMFDCWYLYQLQGKSTVEIKQITHLIGPVYLVDIDVHVWTDFELRAMSIDGERPGVFIDALMLSHLVETPMFQHYSIGTTDSDDPE